MWAEIAPPRALIYQVSLCLTFWRGFGPLQKVSLMDTGIQSHLFFLP